MQKRTLGMAIALLLSIATSVQLANNFRFLNGAVFGSRVTSPLSGVKHAGPLSIDTVSAAVAAHGENGLMMSFGLLALVAARRRSRDSAI